MRRTAASIVGLLGTVFVWDWLLDHRQFPILALALILGGPLTVVVAIWVAARFLRGAPTPERLYAVTALVHFVVLCALGVSLIEILRGGGPAPAPPDAFLHGLGLAVMLASGPVVALTVLNLALSGWGAPSAVSLTRRLASDWLYAHTRNPMALSLFVFFVGLGIWRQSLAFLVWLVCAFVPAFVFFLKRFEERELELRFGRGYLDYKRRVPFMFPRVSGLATPRGRGWAWMALTATVALHVVDEAAHGFLAIYNPTVLRLRESWPFLPLPTFTFTAWIAGLTAAVVLLFALTPAVLRGRRWTMTVGYVYGLLMLLNGLAHVSRTIASGAPMPGVLSSPLLMLAAAALLAALMRRPATFGLASASTLDGRAAHRA